MPVRSPFAVALLTGALLLGTACSSSGGDDAASDTSTTTSTDDGTETDTEATAEETATTSGTATTEDDAPSGSFDADDYTEALVASMRGVGDDALITEDQADCYAPKLVEVLDADRLSEAGVTPQELADSPDFEFPDVDLDEDEANAVYDIYEDCGLDIRSIFIEGMLLGADLDDDEVECLESVVTDDRVRALMVGMIVEGEDDVDSIPEVADFADELRGCVGG